MSVFMPIHDYKSRLKDYMDIRTCIHENAHVSLWMAMYGSSDRCSLDFVTLDTVNVDLVALGMDSVG